MPYKMTEEWHWSGTSMEYNIYTRACIHYKKKWPEETGQLWPDDLVNNTENKIIIKEFWNDYFSGNPLYS